MLAKRRDHVFRKGVHYFLSVYPWASFWGCKTRKEIGWWQVWWLCWSMGGGRQCLSDKKDDFLHVTLRLCLQQVIAESCSSVQVLVVAQLLSCVNSAAPWTEACQASLSLTTYWSFLKLVFIELMMPSNHLILCHPLLLLPSVFPSIRVFSSDSALPIRWPKVLEQLQHQSFQWIFPANVYKAFISKMNISEYAKKNPPVPLLKLSRLYKRLAVRYHNRTPAILLESHNLCPPPPFLLFITQGSRPEQVVNVNWWAGN